MKLPLLTPTTKVGQWAAHSGRWYVTDRQLPPSTPGLGRRAGSKRSAELLVWPQLPPDALTRCEARKQSSRPPWGLIIPLELPELKSRYTKDLRERQPQSHGRQPRLSPGAPSWPSEPWAAPVLASRAAQGSPRTLGRGLCQASVMQISASSPSGGLMPHPSHRAGRFGAAEAPGNRSLTPAGYP